MQQLIAVYASDCHSHIVDQQIEGAARSHVDVFMSNAIRRAAQQQLCDGTAATVSRFFMIGSNNVGNRLPLSLPCRAKLQLGIAAAAECMHVTQRE